MKRHFTLTEDGSHTIFVPGLGDHYHSVHGAVRESLHIFIGKGFREVTCDPVNILEVGFGTGLNALLTLMASETDPRSILYESWETDPLTREEWNLLNYPSLPGFDPGSFFALHESSWDEEVQISKQFTLRKIKGDIRNFHSDHLFDLVYFDAFGPDFQPALWETAVFEKIGASMAPNSRLVTYSAKGQVKRNLRAAGFIVENAPGPPGKREITIALKN